MDAANLDGPYPVGDIIGLIVLGIGSAIIRGTEAINEMKTESNLEGTVEGNSIAGILPGVFNQAKKEGSDEGTSGAETYDGLYAGATADLINQAKKKKDNKDQPKDKADQLGDADFKDLDKLPQDVINENGGEDFTQELKKEGGKSKSNLYWDKDGNIYTVPNNGGAPQWVGWLPR